VAAGAEEGVASVAVLVDDTAFDGSWLYSSAGSVYGGHICFMYARDATNANTTIRRSNFTNGVLTSSGGEAAGGCYFQYGATVTKAHQQIDSCIFRNNTLVGSLVSGGGVMMIMRGDSTEMAVIFLLCVFAHNVLRSGDQDEGANGAGVYMQFHGGAVRSVLLLVERSAFESNVASASGGGEATGAGLKMVVAAEATNMNTTIAHCNFSSNTLRAEGGGGLAYSAAMELNWQGGATAGGLLTTILDSTFEANRAYGSADSLGGAVYLNMQTTNPYSGAVQTVINGCRFLNNAAVGGGAILHSTQQAGASLHVLGCTIRGNSVSGTGAGIYAEQEILNPPANLMMVATKFPGHSVIPYDCDASFDAYSNYSREYNYSSELVIDSCDISNNSAVSKDGAVVKADGGAVYAVINTRTSTSK
jgi:hypothetical protein